MTIRVVARGRVRPPRAGADERGFTIIESVIALGIMFTVVLGLMSALTSGVKGIVSGRQRTTATSIANEVMEQARARSYQEIGHAVTQDTTLATDTALVADGSTYRYAGEVLAGSIIAGDNPPFTPHIWTRVDDNVTYTVSVYVTQVQPASGDSYKRLTVSVTWNKTQFRSTAVRRVRLSTFLYDANQPPDPLLKGLADAEAGQIDLGGAFIGPDVKRTTRWFPYTHSEVDSSFLKRAKGFALTSRSEGEMSGTSGSVSVSGTGCSVSGLIGSCPGARTETIADNDAGTAPPENDGTSPVTVGTTTINTGSVLLNGGTGSAFSSSTARSCWTCFALQIGDDDRYPFAENRAGLTSGFTTTFSSGPLSGTLLRTTSGCAVSDRCSHSMVDVDKVGTDLRVVATARTVLPALDIADISGGPSGYTGMVKVGASDVTATANAGPGAAAPTVTGPAFTVQIYKNVGLTGNEVAGYQSYSITPGVAQELPVTTTTFTSGNDTVTMDATVRAFPKATSSTSSGGAVTHAEARAVSWLQIDVHIVIVHGGGGSTVDMNEHLDYGRVTAVADYRPSS